MSDPALAAPVARALLTWADAGHLRSLPWRTQPRDPYATWVSEIMLQQTQVATAVPYFERWMAQFPTIAALAAAGEGEVLKAWEGLGYYRRALNLHRAAQLVQSRYGGELPADARALRTLPGIGRYTAGAILSIALSHRAAVLDGNVKRVLARVYDVATDIGASATETQLWHLAEGIVAQVESHEAGQLNEAIMDLGATICIPKAPRCPVCPLHDLCLARARGVEEQRPVRSPRPPIPHVDVTAAILHRPGHPGHFLIAQRPAGGMLGGLWEFPGGKCHPGETLVQCLHRELQEELGIDVAVGERLTTVRHAYTHFRITLHAFQCRLLAGEPQSIGVAAWRWVTLADLDAYPFPVTDQKIIATLREVAR